MSAIPYLSPGFGVKSAVAQMAREQRVLARRDFERLCEQPGSEAGSGNSAISDSDEQRALLRLLHDLGVVFAHGLERDAPSANREITLLDPNWLTGAIYTLLNSPTVRDQGGEFRRAQMVDLLDADIYPKDWHEFILGMMQDPEVGLCFELPGSDHERYLVPEAMPANEPDYDDVWPSTALRFSLQVRLSSAGSDPALHRPGSPQPDEKADALADGGAAWCGGLQSACPRRSRPAPH